MHLDATAQRRCESDQPLEREPIQLTAAQVGDARLVGAEPDCDVVGVPAIDPANQLRRQPPFQISDRIMVHDIYNVLRRGRSRDQFTAWRREGLHVLNGS